MNVIKIIKNLNKVETQYCEAKRGLEVLKAELILNTDWNEALGKPKPTVQEKEAFITLQTQKEQCKIDSLKLRKDYLYRMYKVAFLE